MSGATPADDNRSCSCPSVVMILSSLRSCALAELLAAAVSVPALAYVLLPADQDVHGFPPPDRDRSSMAIVDASHGSRLEAGRVYVVPPDRQALVQDGTLLVSDSTDHECAVDASFRSLALEDGARATAIVLSGAGRGGLQGLRSVKAHGGTVIVQDPATAECPEAPRSVIDAGLADVVLAPAAIASALSRRPAGAAVSSAIGTDDEAAALPEPVQRILHVMKVRNKCDFAHYRSPMLLRRIQRRAVAKNMNGVADYARYVETHPDEIAALSKDLLIGVTSFFRDAAVFDMLAAEVLTDLLRRSTHARVWVIGCGTGQEAYSIAMLLTELTAAGPHSGKTFRVFATDIDAASLETARLGIYPASIVNEVSKERLDRFFQKVSDREYRVVRELRSSIVFAKHNLISDPPFSSMGLISCRHLLIYLKPKVQENLFPLFDFALDPGGYLLLSPAEYPAGLQTLSAVSLKHGIFRKTPHATGDVEDARALPPPVVAPPAQRSVRGADALLRKTLLEHCLPAAVLVNSRLDILAVEGPLVSYLEFPPGAMSCNLLQLARRGLRGSLALACRKAARSGEVARDDTARVKRDGRYATCSIVVRPLRDLETGEQLLVVTLRDREEDTDRAGRDPDADSGSVIHRLEEELETTREELNAAIQELVRTNEELRASNIEVMSMNEELKSTNDELETFKEELLSLNEELSLVNGRLRDKLEELDTANSDLANLLAASDIATVFLDAGMNLKRFTPSAAALFGLSAADIGRPFRELELKFRDTNLEADCRRVLTTLAPSEEEVATQARRWYLRRIHPYRTADGAFCGLVITYVDITTRIEAEARARLLADVLLESEEAVIARSFDGRINAWNRGAEAMYGYTEAEARELSFEALVPDDLRRSVSDVAERIARGETVPPFETQRRTRSGRILDVWVVVTAMRDEAGRPIGLATIERDVTARRQAEFEAKRVNVWLERQVRRRTAALERSEFQLRAILDSAVDAIVTVDARGTIKSVNDAVARIFGYSPGELIGKNVKILVPSAPPGVRSEQSRAGGRFGPAKMLGTRREVTACRKDGTPFPAEISVRTVPRLNLYTTWIKDLSERAALHEEILHIATLEQRRIGQELHDTVQQELTALSLLAANFVEELARDGDDERRAAAERIAAEIQVLQERVHSLAEGLVPMEIPADGLAPALRALAGRTTAIHGIDCRVDVPESIVVESDVTATHLFRIAQEAVTNSVRHAHAARVLIRLAAHGDELELGVEDDGRGIGQTSTETPGHGLGLRIIKYRAALIGGMLRVEGRESGGTRVVCRLCVTGTRGKKGNGRARIGKVSRERC